MKVGHMGLSSLKYHISTDKNPAHHNNSSGFGIGLKVNESIAVGFFILAGF